MHKRIVFGLNKTFQHEKLHSKAHLCRNSGMHLRYDIKLHSTKQHATYWERLSAKVNNIFSKRFRQSEKLFGDFYRRILFSQQKKSWLTKFLNFKPQNKPFYLIGGAACSFSWEDSSITDADIQEHINELKMVKSSKNNQCSSLKEIQSINDSDLPEGWENVLDEPNIKIWKLPYKDTGFMQYKVYGRFHDVTARQFFAVQADHEYRKKWDDLALDIDIVDENKKTGEQILRWITYFPFPFNSREYVYIRRAKIFKKDNILTIMSRSVDHPKCVTKKGNVRVPLYISDMVIVPHQCMDEPGLDYLLTYCDDPQTSLPSTLSTWIIYKGIPNYVEQLHQASLNINKNRSVEVTRMVEKFGYEISNFESTQKVGRL